MKHKLLAALLLLTAFAAHGQTWESLNARPYPQWFSDAKLGIFVHWGLYSVPAYAGKEGYGEWFYRGLMTGDSGRCRIMSLYADTALPVFEQYKQLANHWHAELWNPAEWARMFRQSGAKYVVLVTKHHDGYSLWGDPYQPEWNSVVSGPHRNIVGELNNAVRREGLRMGFYYSLPEWSNPRHIWMQDPDSAITDYVDNYMVPQFKDLVSRYRPELIFADGDWQNTPEQLRSVELIDWYYRTVGSDAIVNDRWGQGTQHGFRTPEYSDGINLTDRPWAECRGLGRSFGLNRNEDLDNHLTSTSLIQHFCQLVAHGGGLTLNVGPAADGHIPLIQQERLRDLGKWLEINGEAIYGAHPWSTPCQREHMSAAMPPTTHIDHDWVRNAPLKGMPVDNYEIHWKGTVFAPEEGDYIFRIEADDEAVVRYLTNQQAIHNMQAVDISVYTHHPPALYEPDTMLYYNHAWAENTAAQRTMHLGRAMSRSLWLDVDYKERDLESRVRLTWSRDGGRTFEPVPAQWHGTATWQRTVRCFTQKGDNLYVIEFERPGPTLTIPDMPRLPKGTAVTLLGTTDNIRWRQKRDGTLTLDLSRLDPKQLNALDHAWVFQITNAVTH